MGHMGPTQKKTITPNGLKRWIDKKGMSDNIIVEIYVKPTPLNHLKERGYNAKPTLLGKIERPIDAWGGWVQINPCDIRRLPRRKYEGYLDSASYKYTLQNGANNLVIYDTYMADILREVEWPFCERNGQEIAINLDDNYSDFIEYLYEAATARRTSRKKHVADNVQAKPHSA
ncbi:hypothetical protein FACS189421_11740 [Bacteroidia bacterium]|nr:hypothetical protein FACS189421_11740 [Bacteroidia bacterium]